MLLMQDCDPVPANTTFAVDSLFPEDKSYYAYRCLTVRSPARIPCTGYAHSDNLGAVGRVLLCDGLVSDAQAAEVVARRRECTKV